MPDEWLPGAYRDPGRNSGYNSGHNQMLRTVAHYTVGNDSRAVGRNGYFTFLVHKDESRENGCTQYAEVNAVTWHAANQGNSYGPGVEFERMTTGGYNAEGLANADPLTENQITWGHRLVTFMASWGIPIDLWSGARYSPEVMPGGGYRGWVNHHDIDSDRADGLLRAEWDQITAGAITPPAPSIINREAINAMWIAYLPYVNPSGWVDVYYFGVQVDSFANEGGTPATFGIGPKLHALMDQGIIVTTFTNKDEYEGKGRVRDQVTAQYRLALQELARP